MTDIEAEYIVTLMEDAFPQWKITDRQRSMCVKKLMRFDDPDAFGQVVEEYYTENNGKRTPNLGDIITMWRTWSSSRRGGRGPKTLDCVLFYTPIYVAQTEVPEWHKGGPGWMIPMCYPPTWPPMAEIRIAARKVAENCCEKYGGMFEVFELDRGGQIVIDAMCEHRKSLQDDSGWTRKKEIAAAARADKNKPSRDIPDLIRQRMEESTPKQQTVGAFLPSSPEEMATVKERPKRDVERDEVGLPANNDVAEPNW